MPLFLNTPICPLYTHVLVTSLCIRLGYFCIHTVTGCLNNIDLYKAFPTRPPHCPDWSPPESSCPCDLSGMQRRYLTEGSVVFTLVPQLLPWPTSRWLAEHVFTKIVHRPGWKCIGCFPLTAESRYWKGDQGSEHSAQCWAQFLPTDLPVPSEEVETKTKSLHCCSDSIKASTPSLTVIQTTFITSQSVQWVCRPIYLAMLQANVCVCVDSHLSPSSLQQ